MVADGADLRGSRPDLLSGSRHEPGFLWTAVRGASRRITSGRYQKVVRARCAMIVKRAPGRSAQIRQIRDQFVGASRAAFPEFPEEPIFGMSDVTRVGWASQAADRGE